MLGLEPGWTAQHTGVLTRYHSEEARSAVLGAQVARDAVARAGLELSDIGLILSGSGTMQQPIPCNAALIAAELGGEVAGVPAFDVNSTCLGFLTALDVASRMLHPERCRHALIVTCELGARGLNPNQKESFGLMGDGAAAAVVSYDESGASLLLASRMETYAEGGAYVSIEGGGTRLPAWSMTPENEPQYRFRMDGRRLVQFALNYAPAFLDRLLGEAGIRMDEVAVVVPHQASMPALHLLRRKLGIPAERFVVTVDRVGNTIASSLPIALHAAIADGRLARGQVALVVGTSAGFSIGGVALRY
jgi:3-oxoacyl-[acyl-carrier-protein] synthase-3